MDDINLTLAAALLRRIFKEYYRSDWAALLDIRDAVNQNCDPFQLLAVHFNLNEKEIYQRAAKAINLAYSDRVPALSVETYDVEKIERLHITRGIRGKMLDREIMFVAPDFWQLVELAKAVANNPGLHGFICLVPPKNLRANIVKQQGQALHNRAINRLASIWPTASAHINLPVWTRVSFFAVIIIIAISIGFRLPLYQPLVTIIAIIIFLIPASFRLACALGGGALPPYKTETLLSDSELPVYSVFIPLHGEAAMVKQLVEAMRDLNYPAHKLDIKFVVEANSEKTIAEIKHFLDDVRFELVEVPEGNPQTKPKAINFALPFARGEYIVVYDAEDIPEPDQLRKAATLFARYPKLECLQAALVIDNASENALTALFAAEYAAQFGLIMPTLAYFKMPMPLGGTSNHFRLASLKSIGAWDSYNVTEDADLGIRLSRWHMKCGILDSYTREEAPITPWAWVRQRTRWMKGWMQTLLVHSMDFKLLIKQMSPINILVFYIYVGGLVLAAPLHGAFVIRLLVDIFWMQGQNMADYLTFNIYLIVLVTGYLSAFILAFLGLWRTKQLHLHAYQILLPFYWLLTSLATLRAAWQLTVDPFSWEKTEHARTTMSRKGAKAAPKPSTGDEKSIYL